MPYGGPIWSYRENDTDLYVQYNIFFCTITFLGDKVMHFYYVPMLNSEIRTILTTAWTLGS